MFEFLKWKKPQTLEVEPQTPLNFTKVPVEGVRRGMWVKTESGRIGIVNALNDDGTAEIHLTDAEGNTIDWVFLGTNQFEQAKTSDIPEARLSGRSRNDMRAFGYKD